MNREIFRYGVAGGLAFLIDFTVLYVCTEFLGLHYLVSNVFGYFSGLILSYILNTRWVFSYRKYEKTLTEFGIFNLIVIAGLALSEGLMLLLVGTFEQHYLQAKIVAAIFVTVFNYIAKKYILFHPTPTPGEP